MLIRISVGKSNRPVFVLCTATSAIFVESKYVFIQSLVPGKVIITGLFDEHRTVLTASLCSTKPQYFCQ